MNNIKMKESTNALKPAHYIVWILKRVPKYEQSTNSKARINDVKYISMIPLETELLSNFLFLE